LTNDEIPRAPEGLPYKKRTTMGEKTVLALRVMAGAAVMGILGDLLLRQFPWGLNVFLWLAAAVAAVVVILLLHPSAGARVNRWMLAAVIVFGALFVWRASIPLKLMDVFAVFVAASLASPLPGRVSVRLASLAHYVVSGITAGIHAALGPLLLVFGDVEWKEVSGRQWGRPALAVGRGVLLAAAPLLVFGVLLMSADAVFDHIVRATFHINVARVLLHVFVIAFCAWIVAGTLRRVLISDNLPQEPKGLPQMFSLGIVEVGIVLGLLDLLFLAFVAVQVRYLFGGAPLVGVTPGLTYAEYARHGFFELVAVAALVLPLLLAAHWLLRQEGRARGIFRALAGVQILLLFVIMASALRRMRLYTDQFGLTEQRLYATAFMAWLAVVFLWFAFTVLRARRERFAFGAMTAGFLLIGVLHVLNPDALIVRTNVERAGEGKRFDASYITDLSADAVPVVLPHLEDLKPQDSRTIATRILKQWPAGKRTDWRSWSWSRARAAGAVGSHRTIIEQMAGTGGQ
jgi:Domain of unknown function (DUF4153)